jgi:predicted lipid-binding transport protein (Tim44 family)
MMSKITIATGIALIILGVGFYIGTGSAHVTSLIPAFVGLPVAILGFVACCGGESARKHAAHVAVMLTMLGALAGLGRGIPGIFKGADKAAIAATLLMAAICIVHVIFSVRSFIAARKAREAAAKG